MKKTCVSCNVLVLDYVEFKCPKCLSEKVVRCRDCRNSANPYKMNCGFEGP